MEQNATQKDDTRSGPDSSGARQKFYACNRYPYLSLGGKRLKVRFEDGFFETDAPDLQDLIEGSGGFGISITDITRFINMKREVDPSKVYLSFENPNLKIGMRASFHDGVLVTDNGSLRLAVENLPEFGRSIREVGNIIAAVERRRKGAAMAEDLES